MKIAGKRCGNCGTQTPDREIAEDEVCNCGSQICLMSSAQVCTTTNRPRTGTFRRSERETVEVKSFEAPPRNRMIRTPALRK